MQIIFFGHERYLKEVIHAEDQSNMINIASAKHEKNHFGMNKSEHYFNFLYFQLKREVIHEIINKRFKYSQTKPLKNKITMEHIKAERYQIDCVDLSRYET